MTILSRGTGDTVTGTTWASTANAFDGAAGTTPATYATWTNSTRSVTGTIEITGYDFSAIPAGAVINSVTVTLRHMYSVSGAPISSVSVQPKSAGSNADTAQNGTIGVANTPHTDTLTFPGVSLAELQATFTVAVTTTRTNSTTSAVWSVDYVDVAVDFTVTSADSAAGADAVTLIALTVTDSGAATSTAGVAVTDADSGLSTASVFLALSNSDSAVGVDSAVLLASVAGSDSGSSSETAVAPAGHVTAELWENGTFVASLGVYAVTSTSGEVASFTFDAGLLSDPTGAGVEIRLYSDVVRQVDVGAVEWNVSTLVPLGQQSKSSSDSGVATVTQSIALSAADSAIGADTVGSVGPSATDAASTAVTMAIVAASVVTDSAAAAETAAIALSANDAGATLDVGVIAATVTALDTGTVGDGPALDLLTVTTADTATGADAAAIALSTADAGVSATTISLALTDSDTATGVETAALATSDQDAAFAADTAAVNATVAASDPVTETDTVALALADVDAATTVEAGAVSTSILGSDVVTATDIVGGVALTDSHGGSVVDTAAISATVSSSDLESSSDTQALLLTAADTAAGAETASLQLSDSDSFNGLASESTIAVTVNDADTATVNDGPPEAITEQDMFDSAAITETVLIQIQLAAADAGVLDTTLLLAIPTVSDLASMAETQAQSTLQTAIDTFAGSDIEHFRYRVFLGAQPMTMAMEPTAPTFKFTTGPGL